MLSNFRQIGGGGSGGGSFTPSYIPLRGDFLIDTSLAYSDTEVQAFTFQAPAVLKEFATELQSNRTAGSLTFQLKLNGSIIPGASFTINGTNLKFNQVTSLNVNINDGDRVSVHITDAGYTPGSNRGYITLLIQ